MFTGQCEKPKRGFTRKARTKNKSTVHEVTKNINR